MIRKSVKYFIIAGINLAVLTAMLALWTDKLVLNFNAFARPVEFLKIISLSILSLAGMRLLVYYCRRKNITNLRKKVVMACICTLVISAYLYAGYSYRIMQNIIINRQVRQGAAAKIGPSIGLAYGSKANGLTMPEYVAVSKEAGFPDIPVESTNIGYDYTYDGFLPDYAFSVTYYVPLQMHVDTLDFRKGSFSKHQGFMLTGDKKKVTYEEYQE